jgi:acyl carrier protein
MSKPSEVEIRGWVRGIVRDELQLSGATEIGDATSWRQELNADSLQAHMILMDLEERFEIAIPDDDMNGIDNLDQAVQYIQRRLAG